MQLWLMRIPTQYYQLSVKLIMPIGQSKAKWQCKLRNLVANFENNANGATWWPNFQLCHLLAKFASNTSGAIWWSNLQLMQVVPSGGQICNLYKWCHVVSKFNPKSRSQFLGPLCLWQCLENTAQTLICKPPEHRKHHLNPKWGDLISSHFMYVFRDISI